MTPERIAEIRALPHDNWRIVHELVDAIEAARAELASLRIMLEGAQAQNIEIRAALRAQATTSGEVGG